MFTLKQPFTLDELKTAYRAAVKKVHPDLGGTVDNFRAVQLQYENLLLFASIDKNRSVCTTDGTLVSKLGMGLGLTKNGKECHQCLGNGYHASKVGGIREACSNTVHFNRVSDNLWTDSLFIPRKKYGPSCALCHDNGYIIREQRTIYVRCFTCLGTGEVEVWNPVLPKGLITERKE